MMSLSNKATTAVDSEDPPSAQNDHSWLQSPTFRNRANSSGKTLDMHALRNRLHDHDLSVHGGSVSHRNDSADLASEMSHALYSIKQAYSRRECDRCIDECVRLLRRADTLDAITPPHIAFVLLHLINACIEKLDCQQAHDAIQQLQKVVDVISAHEPLTGPRWQVKLHQCRSRCLEAQGDFESATTELQSAWLLQAEWCGPESIPAMRTLVAISELHVARWDDARAYVLLKQLDRKADVLRREAFGLYSAFQRAIIGIQVRQRKFQTAQSTCESLLHFLAGIISHAEEHSVSFAEGAESSAVSRSDKTSSARIESLLRDAKLEYASASLLHGDILSEQHDAQGAYSAYEEAWKVFAQCFGPCHIAAVRTETKMAEVVDLLGPGRTEEDGLAMLLAREDALSAPGPGISSGTAAVLNSKSMIEVYEALGEAYLRRQRPRDAARAFEQGLSLIVMVLGPEAPLAFQMQSKLAEALQRDGKYAESLALLKETLRFAIRNPALAPIPQYVIQHNIATNYRLQENFGEALRCYEDALRLIGDRDSESRAKILGSMAGVQATLRNIPAAIELNRHALRLRKAHYGDEHVEVAASLANLSKLHLSNNEPHEALQSSQQAVAVLQICGIPQSNPIYVTSCQLQSQATRRLREEEQRKRAVASGPVFRR